MSDQYISGYGHIDEMQSPDLSAPQVEAPIQHFFSSAVSLPGNQSSTKKSEEAAMQSISVIFQLEDATTLNSTQDMDTDEAPQIDLEDQHRRTQRLTAILPALEQLCWSGSIHAVDASEKLADGSRDRKFSSG